MKYIAESPKDLERAAEVLISIAEKTAKGRAFVVGLSGELGAGKTTFTKVLGKELGVSRMIISPTFILERDYVIPKKSPVSKRYTTLVHIDAYRLTKHDNMFAAHLKNLFSDPKNIILIEWPERIKTLMPKGTTYMTFAHKTETERHVHIKPPKSDPKDSVQSMRGWGILADMAGAKSSKKRPLLVLLDSHAIIHRAYHALPEFSTSTGEPTGGLYGVASMLMKILSELKPDYVMACYDLPKPTFRHAAFEGYKAKRPKADDALVQQINRSRDIFKTFGIPIYEKEGFEADDILGTVAEQLRGEGVDIVIASGDMDTLQLVEGNRVRVYTLRKGLTDTITYDEKAVKERFGFPPALIADYKGLSGDPSDNIVGIAGIGAKTATTLITNFGTVEDIYKTLEQKGEKPFLEAGITKRIVGLLEEGKEEALFSKTLATIRRDAPIEISLPEKSWKEHDPEAAIDLFTELEFRSLVPRLRALFGQEAKEAEHAPVADASPLDVKRVGIALWVLRSDITSPDLDDILRHTKARDIKSAEEAILKELKAKKLLSVYEDIELPLIPIVENMEERGILIDKPYLAELSKKYHTILSGLERDIFKEAGKEFNINSPKQLGEILFDEMQLTAKGLKKTAGGARSTRESELAKLKDTHPIIEHILRYREVQKLLSTYIDNMPGMADSEGRIHARFNQAGTTTGRFSSSNPNLQNIPTRDGMGTEVRNAFVAKKGCTLASFDYSQIEIRVLAALSEDKTLKEVFQKGGDVHASVASRVFGVSEADVTKEMRRKAKVINFGIIYGMGVNALRENLGGTRAEAQEFYEHYFQTFPKVAEYFEEVKGKAAKNGFTETFFGRRRYFADIRSTIPYIRASAERMAMNAPLQGTAADIIKIAMVKTEHALAGRGMTEKAKLLLQVHDELVYEIDEESVEEVGKIIAHTMETAVEFPVPLVVSSGTGKRWGDIK